jgi:glycosyltransferase involved in cell wall biosynthesis
LRVCIAYDRLYPWSIGGAERWYRALAERLAADGHAVTYLTTRQWPPGEEPRIPGVHVNAIAENDQLYSRSRRRILPVMRFGVALARHLLRHGHRYDVVHTSAMAAWSALAAASLARLHRFRVVLDWWEVWSAAYWRQYLGPLAGSGAWLLQHQVARLPHQPIAYSTLHASRLHRLRGEHPVPVLRGLLPTTYALPRPRRAELRVVYAGRHIAEKQTPAIVAGIARARECLPALQATLFGDGPSFAETARAVEAADLEDAIELPGFVAEPLLNETLSRSLCLVLLSRREGYGLVVAEAAALGVPSVVLRHPDSAATELVSDGVNGVVCKSTAPDDVASAILGVYDAGDELRQRTLGWFHQHAEALSVEGSLPRLLAIYRGKAGEEEQDA